MGSTSSVSMLPSPSRLKSLASEFSPVLTTPPPVEPKTVLVLISVPEIMLSSNFVPFWRRAAMSPAMPPRIARAPRPSTQLGVPERRSAKNPGGSDLGTGAALGATAIGGGDDGVAAFGSAPGAGGGGVAVAPVAGAAGALAGVDVVAAGPGVAGMAP